MNETLNLVEILKDCPKGTKLYSTIFGEVEFGFIEDHSTYPIVLILNGGHEYLTSDGKLFNQFDGECILFPSKEQRDWSKFKVKKHKFDHNTLKPFDKVLVRETDSGDWCCGLFSHRVVFDDICKYNVGEILYAMCIPYNEDTKHLVGTTEEAPEYYRYWED